ncbi:hypothetical protein [Neorhizobium sp. JUb45]|nr:hypothetical protein [Neorhizobium sp. JUb45]
MTPNIHFRNPPDQKHTGKHAAQGHEADNRADDMPPSLPFPERAETV